MDMRTQLKIILITVAKNNDSIHKERKNFALVHWCP